MLDPLSLPIHCKTCNARYPLDIPGVTDTACTPLNPEKLVEPLDHT
jgi:hypothetical protein